MHEGHRKRLKSRFLSEGLDNFNPHNVLELLLFYSIPRKDTNEIAHRLIERFGSLAGVFDASVEDLMQVKGITLHSACLIKMIIPMSRYYSADKFRRKIVLNSPTLCGDYLLARYLGYTNEIVSLISMDNQCRIISFDIIGEGDICSAGISTRKVIETVLRTKATSAVIAHNHPGGIALPSKEDIEATINIIEALRVVGVYLLDHIILAGDDYVSLADSKEYQYLFNY